MPITTLDPAAALVVIDLQKGLAAIQTVHPMADIIDRSARLARAFRERDLPVVLVNVAGRPSGRTQAGGGNFPVSPDWAELVDELDQHPTDHLVTKHSPGAFIGTNLDSYLRSRNVTQIFLTGVSTNSGVEATARSAYDFGYNVAVVIDAISDRDLALHNDRVENFFPRIAETDTTENVLKLLRG